MRGLRNPVIEVARRLARLALTSGACLAASGALAASGPPPGPPGPRHELDRLQLEAVMEDLIAWLPGAWDNYPQLHYERTVTMPAGGEHEPWHRSFARIDAPQVGEYVFYGQINAGGRSGPLIPRSQVLYKAVIDEKRGVVSITGQGPADPEKFVNLHERPELWKSVRMRDESAVRCDFVWRRDGAQLVGVLEGKTPERRKYGPGTCAYMSERGEEFYADAEWVLTPEELWIYDINTMGGTLFIGRADRTHVRLSRVRPYVCELQDAAGRRRLDAYDRGWKQVVKAAGGETLELMLLRAQYPAADGFGLDDRLRLTLSREEGRTIVASAQAEPLARSIELAAQGIEARCTLGSKLAPLPVE